MLMAKSTIAIYCFAGLQFLVNLVLGICALPSRIRAIQEEEGCTPYICFAVFESLTLIRLRPKKYTWRGKGPRTAVKQEEAPFIE